MPDSRTLWTAVVIICIAVSVFFSVKKRTTFKRLQQLMAAKQWDEFDRLLDDKLTSMLYPRYNRDYLRLNSYLLREDHKRASEMFDLLLGLNLPKMQRVDLVIKAFNYYVGQEDRKKSKELLHEIKGFEGGQAAGLHAACKILDGQVFPLQIVLQDMAGAGALFAHKQALCQQVVDAAHGCRQRIGSAADRQKALCTKQQRIVYALGKRALYDGKVDGAVIQGAEQLLCIRHMHGNLRIRVLL